MKNRKLNQLLVAGMISAAMMTSGISVQAADFSDDTSTVEEQSVGSAEEEAPEVEDGSHRKQWALVIHTLISTRTVRCTAHLFSIGSEEKVFMDLLWDSATSRILK